MSVHICAACWLHVRRRIGGRAMLVLCTLLTVGGLLPARAGAQDVPTGTVSYFPGTTCPAGWNAPDYAKGRMIVGTLAPAAIGSTFGLPLSDQEDRKHRHQYATAIPVAPKPICGLCSCCNQQGATAYPLPRVSVSAYPIEGETDLSSTGLPFIQYLVCEKG
jgi:hypothetical protein